MYAETLQCAAEALGSMDRLAEVLKVPRETLSAWLSGRSPAPLHIFVHALDILTDAPPSTPEPPRAANIHIHISMRNR